MIAVWNFIRKKNEMTPNTIDRTKIIGGSDIAAVMGLSRWKTPLSLWAEKTGRIQNDLSNFEAAEIGTELEEYVSRKFTKKTGIPLRVDNRTFKHPEYEYMVVHIDRWVIKQDAVFEAKTCSAYKEKEWAGEDIPTEYVLQLNWALGIVGKKIGYIAVLIGGQKFIYKQIEFDLGLFEKQVAAAKNFWESFVLLDLAPVAQAGDSETLFEMFPQSEANGLRFEGKDAEALNHLIEERTGGLESINHAKEELEKIDAQIKQYLGPAESGETDEYRVTWKTQNRKEYVVKANSFRVLNCKKKGA